MLRPARNKSDLNRIREIHEKFYQEEFPFPDLSQFSWYGLAEKDNEIIAMGGFRLISELVFITDKDTSPFDRYRSLTELLDACKAVTKYTGRDQAYAMAEGSEWIKTLKRVGFEQFKAVPLVINID